MKWSNQTSDSNKRSSEPKLDSNNIAEGFVQRNNCNPQNCYCLQLLFGCPNSSSFVTVKIHSLQAYCNIWWRFLTVNPLKHIMPVCCAMCNPWIKGKVSEKCARIIGNHLHDISSRLAYGDNYATPNMKVSVDSVLISVGQTYQLISLLTWLNTQQSHYWCSNNIIHADQDI